MGGHGASYYWNTKEEEYQRRHVKDDDGMERTRSIGDDTWRRGAPKMAWREGSRGRV